jgi:NTP pyrophosphatase (non-canonical NTP hydrolase)
MQYAQAQENATLRNRLQGQDLERQLEQIEARNMEELREVASALGVSPDSPMVDYGDQNDSIADRLASVRASAKIAVKPATPVVAPSRTGDAVHNTQPAMPAPARTANSGRVTAEQLEAAAASYARNYSDATKRAAAEVTLRELQEKFATQEL